MKVLYFDCFSGISGDMALGAMLDLGVDAEDFLFEIKKLALDGYEIKINRKTIHGITGTDVEITSEEKHSHIHRKLSDITELISSSALKPSVIETSLEIFREIARAEAAVHGVDENEIHFHEVGAMDSILDIVGCAICLDLLGIERVFSSPLHDGKGTTVCSHGTIPIPVPAVLEMLRGSDIPLISEEINLELVTPTGMAFIKTVAASFGKMPAMMIDNIGYGFGKHDTGKLNALRVIEGDLFGNYDELEEIVMLETNLDNISAEVLGYTMGKLLEKGAVDVFYTPVYMKKNRPAYMLTALTPHTAEKDIAEIIFKETGTLGIRRRITERYVAKRSIESISTKFGDVRVKISGTDKDIRYSPEYEDCRKIAKEKDIPLYRVFDEVRRDLIDKGRIN